MACKLTHHDHKQSQCLSINVLNDLNSAQANLHHNAHMSAFCWHAGRRSSSIIEAMDHAADLQPQDSMQVWIMLQLLQQQQQQQQHKSKMDKRIEHNWNHGPCCTPPAIRQRSSLGDWVAHQIAGGKR